MATFSNQTQKSSSSVIRRSANYKANIWEYDLVQSLTTNYSTDEEKYTRKRENLIDQVMIYLLDIIDQEIVVSLLPQVQAQLEMIDDLGRLGLTHLFENEIKLALDRCYAFNNTENVDVTNDLYCAALGFRLFRQHGYMVSQEYCACRWNIDEMTQLPEYLKICFLALYDTINEFVHYTLTENGVEILTYLKKAWTDLCKYFLVEAKWYHSGYIPTFEEYLDIGWNSSGGYVILLHAYVFSNKDITIETLKFLESKPDLIRWPSMILRLTDDLETSMDEIERGDVPKSIECYMHQTHASEKVAREYIQCLLDDTWKKMNTELYLSSSSPIFAQFVGNIGVNLGRMSQCMFQCGDGYGNPDGNTKDNILALLFKPILSVE